MFAGVEPWIWLSGLVVNKGSWSYTGHDGWVVVLGWRTRLVNDTRQSRPWGNGGVDFTYVVVP